MKRKLRILIAVLAIMLISGCTNQANTEENEASSSLESNESQNTIQLSENISGNTSQESLLDISQIFTHRDLDGSYDESVSAVVTLNGSSANCSLDAVSISDSIVTIEDEGTYILSGTLDNGMVIVNAENTDKIQLVLDGVSINSNTSAAIYVAQADKVFITLATDSKNILTNGGEFVPIDDNNIDAVVFSKDDLTFNGEGSLTITSPIGHGVVSKDDLVFTGGNYDITSKAQGLSGKDSVRIADGVFTIMAGKDGIHSENTDDTALGFVYIGNGSYNITSDGDGITASNIMQIDDGSFIIKTGGGSDTVSLDSKGNWGWGRPGEHQNTNTDEDTVSVKGIKSTGALLVNGGDFTIDSADDALHSNGNLTVNGGTWDISTGDDGLHGDETVTITNGEIIITKSYEGIEGQNIIISGGTINLVSSDDGINAAGGSDGSGNGGFGGFQKGDFDTASDCAITILGGTLYINASGDGVDSNGDLIVNGGETYVSGPTDNGNGPLDYNGEASITGGIFVAAGSSGMAQNFGDASTQGAMLLSVSGSLNDVIILKDSSGKELVSYTADKGFDSVVISCPEIKQGESYTVSVGDSTQDVNMDSLIYTSTDIGRGPGGKGGKPNVQPKNRDEFSEGMGNPPEGMGNPPKSRGEGISGGGNRPDAVTGATENIGKDSGGV